jgi:hypothetical protein
MRCNRLILVLGAAFILLIQTGCQRQATEGQAVTDADRPGPKITFEKVVHDFGEVGPRTNKTCEFKFTNTGDSLLKIPKVDACCGVEAKSDRKEYAPGESGTVKVEYHVGSQLGADVNRLDVYTNDWARRTVTLTIMAKVVQKIELEPAKLKLALNKENAGCPEITISSRDGKSFALTEFKSTGDSITADVDRSMTATKFVLQPKVNLEKLQKNSSGRIDISTTHPECDKVTVYFEGLPIFTINPSRIIAFNAKPREPILRKLLILNNYGDDFEVESTSSKNKFVQVLARKKVDKGYQFDVQIMPPDAVEERTFADELFVNIKGQERLVITCRGFY